MGIIYNRFIPDGNASPLIIPYSDRSKILTYLTYDSWVGVGYDWGAGWPIQMQRVQMSGATGNSGWSQITSDQAIRLYCSQSNPKYVFRIIGTTAISNSFYGGTFYIVCKFSTSDKNPRFYTYNTNNRYAYVFTSGREPGSNFNVNDWGKGSQYIQLDSKMHDYYNVYAVNYYYDSTASTFDVFAMFNAFTLKWAQQSGSMIKPTALWEKREQGNMDIKFLAIVNGRESDDAIIKNVHNIMKYFNINDGRYW